MPIVAIPNYSEAQNQLSELKNHVAQTQSIHSCGTLSTKDLSTIKAKGFRVIISLIDEAPSETILLKLTAEQMGLKFIHVPVSWKTPTLNSLDLFFNQMKANDDAKILAYCRVNWRASAFIYLYQVIVEQQDETEARATLLKVWNPWKNKTWSRFLQEAKKYFGSNPQ